MILPILQITSDTLPCAVLVNGAVVGDTTQPPTVPLAPDGAAYITCLPFSACALPVTLCLYLEKGMPTRAVENGTLYLHPDGRMELCVHPTVFAPFLPWEPPHAISRVHFSWGNVPHTATLYRDNGLKLAIENPAADSLIFWDAPRHEGQLRLVHAFTETDLLLEGDHAVTLFSPLSGSFRVLFHREGKAEISPGRVVVCCLLPDARGHQARYVYTQDQKGVACTPPQYGYFTVSPRDSFDVRRALVDAVQLGLEEECMLLMTPALKDGLTFAELQDFLGPFTSVHAADERGLLLRYPLFEQCYSLKHFSFSVQNGLVANIAE